MPANTSHRSDNFGFQSFKPPAARLRPFECTNSHWPSQNRKGKEKTTTTTTGPSSNGYHNNNNNNNDDDDDADDDDNDDDDEDDEDDDNNDNDDNDDNKDNDNDNDNTNKNKNENEDQKQMPALQQDAARSMSCPQVHMKSPSLFPSPDPYRHRRCAKLYIYLDRLDR